MLNLLRSIQVTSGNAQAYTSYCEFGELGAKAMQGRIERGDRFFGLWGETAPINESPNLSPGASLDLVIVLI